LVELDPFTVDADEDVGHLLFIDGRGNLESGEGVFLQVKETVKTRYGNDSRENGPHLAFISVTTA
jgi:hypothetical protein